MKAHRISRPEWARKPRVMRDGIFDEALHRLQAAREALLAVVHAEVSAYLCNPQLVFESSDEFPSRQRLTGDYYIADEYYRFTPASGRHSVAVQVHCLGWPPSPQSEPDDYLGLEVWLESSPDCRTFSVFRNTDSSVI